MTARTDAELRADVERRIAWSSTIDHRDIAGRIAADRAGRVAKHLVGPRLQHCLRFAVFRNPPARFEALDGFLVFREEETK